jgi:hypothetical protein
MGPFIGVYFDIIVPLEILAALAAFSLLRAWLLQRHEPDYHSVQNAQLTFAYPPALVLPALIAGWLLVLWAILWIAFAPQRQAWFSVAFLAVGLFCLSTWYRLTGRVIVDSKTITLHRLGRHTTIPYNAISTVEHNRKLRCIVVRAERRSIRIEQQLERYPTFCDAARFYCSRARRTRSEDDWAASFR